MAILKQPKISKLDFDLTDEFLKINARHIENYNEIVKHEAEIKKINSSLHSLSCINDKLDHDLSHYMTIAYSNYKTNKERIDELEQNLSKGISIPTYDSSVKLKAWVFLCFCLICLQYLLFYWNFHGAAQ